MQYYLETLAHAIAIPCCDWNAAHVPRGIGCFVVRFPKSSIAVCFAQCHLVHILPISCFFANGFVSCDATACAHPIRIDQVNAIQGQLLSTDLTGKTPETLYLQDDNQIADLVINLDNFVALVF